MSTLEKAPGSQHPEDEVSIRADQIVESAGEAVIAATDGMEEQAIKEGGTSSDTITKAEGGKLTSVSESSDWGLGLGGNSRQVKVAKRPGIVARVKRIFKRPEPVRSDEHSVTSYDDGTVIHTTTRPSVLGGTVEKQSIVSTSRDGTKNVSYSVTRYDADGNEVERKPTGRRIAMQRSSEEVSADRARENEVERIEDPQERERRRARERERREDRQARDEVVLETAKTISERANKALKGDKSDLSPVPSDRKKVPQVPREASKYAESYTAKRRAEQEAIKNDPNSLEYAIDQLDLK